MRRVSMSMSNLPLVLSLAVFATYLTAFTASATPVEVISAERRVELAMEDSVWVLDEPPVKVDARLGPFADSITETGNFDSSFVGVIQTGQDDSHRTLIGEARQTSHISGDHVSYSGFVQGRDEPGLVTPDVYSGLELLDVLGYRCCGSVDGVSTLDVLLEVQSVTDFVFEFTWDTWGDPTNGPEFSLENIDTGESVFWGLGDLFFVGGEWVDGSENGGSLDGTLDPGNYALSAAIWSHWSYTSREAPGGSLDLALSFGAPIPEPSAALAFAVGVLIVGGAVRRRV